MRKYRHKLLCFLSGMIFCLPVWSQGEMQFDFYEGGWEASLLTPGGKLPFVLVINQSSVDSSYKFTIKNSKEEIATSDIEKSGDSIIVRMPVFNTYFIFKPVAYDNYFGPSEISSIDGDWVDLSRNSNYRLHFHAEAVTQPLVAEAGMDEKIRQLKKISGRWDMIFKDESSTDSTVAIFKQYNQTISGTILTTTGDYRFLSGKMNLYTSNEFYLSTFDGSHAFLFKGKINDDGTLSGDYWSGKHYHANFTASKNENAKLPDPKKLTYLKEGYSKIEFSFPDENGNLISLEDERFKNKVVVIQITGSWCPNCMDETSYMSEVEEKYKNKDLAIIALSFERQPDPQNFKINIDRLKNHFGIDYLYLNAGLPKNASDALTMLNHVMGFPTTIILNKKHEVAEIYTGFNGPATGQLFLDYQKDFEELVERLMND